MEVIIRRRKAWEIIDHLEQLGVLLECPGWRRLRYSPKSAVSPEWMKLIKEYKPEIIQLIDPVSWEDWKPKETDRDRWCTRYQHPRAWKSIYGDHLICGTCCPPVSNNVVAEWIQRE
jgi:TubC N-terminal docking domain